MKKSFFAISMGFIDPNPFIISSSKTDNIYSRILRDIAEAYLDFGAKFYLDHSVESVESLDDVFEIIIHKGFCIIQFEKELCLSHKGVIKEARLVVRRHALELMKDVSIEDQNMQINNFEKAFKPYIALSFAEDKSIDTIIKELKSALEIKIQFGRSLSLDTKDSLIALLSGKSVVKVA